MGAWVPPLQWECHQNGSVIAISTNQHPELIGHFTWLPIHQKVGLIFLIIKIDGLANG